MTADVEEAAQHLVLAADDDDRLAAGQLAGDVVAGRTQLIEAARHCQLRRKTVRSSRSSTRGSVYQGAGMVDARSSGASAS